jgi:peptidoglycan/LPS O-acetylase OafA/YrhL
MTLITFAALWSTDPNFDIHKWSCHALVILNLTFLRSFFEEFLFTGVAQGWMLTVEETFYFLAPLLLLVITISKNKYVVPALFALSCLVFVFLSVKLLPHPYGFFSKFAFVFYQTFSGVLSSLCLARPW